MAETREAHVFETEDGKQVAVEPFSLKGFVSKHKWKIAGGALVVGGLIFAKKKVGNKPIKNFFNKKESVNLDTGLITGGKSYKDLDIPADFVSARIDELWMEDDDVLGIMNDIPITDLGEFGKELKEKIPELKDKDFAHLACVGFTKYNIDGPFVDGTINGREIKVTNF